MAYIYTNDDASRLLTKALSKGLNRITKPTVDVRYAIVNPTNPNGARTTVSITVSFTAPNPVTVGQGAIWLNADPNSSSYRTFSVSTGVSFIPLGASVDTSTEAQFSIPNPTLTPASTTSIGGIKIGNNLVIAPDGTVNASTLSLRLATLANTARGNNVFDRGMMVSPPIVTTDNSVNPANPVAYTYYGTTPRPDIYAGIRGVDPAFFYNFSGAGLLRFEGPRTAASTWSLTANGVLPFYTDAPIVQVGCGASTNNYRFRVNGQYIDSGVTNITPSNVGAGYTDGLYNLVVTSTTGKNASATARVTGGAVVTASIIITNPGEDYASAPTFTLPPAAGAGTTTAVFVATVGSLGIACPSATAVTLNFGSRTLRLIEVEFFADHGFWNITVGQDDTIYAAPQPSTKILLIGDSFVGNTMAPANLAGLSFPAAFREISGTNVIPQGVGGSGWLTGNVLSNSWRIGDAGLISNVDGVAIALGINDTSLAGVGIAAAVTSTLTALRALPNLASVPIVVFGAWPAAANFSANLLATDAAISAGVTAMNDPLIKFVPINVAGSNPYVWGTKYSGQSTGVAGNSYWVTGTDGTHPSVPGAEYLGRRAVPDFTKAIVSMGR